MVISIVYVVGASLTLIVAHLTGKKLMLYETTKWFDLMLHTFAGLTLLTPIGFGLAATLSTSLLLRLMFAFCFSVTITTIWEIFEFAMDFIFGTNMQRWKDSYTTERNGGVIDIMTDIIAGIVGTILSCIAILILAVLI